MNTFLFILIYSCAIFAKDHTVPTPVGNIHFETSEKEISQRNFFGADLWFTGVVNHNKRNVMSIVYSASGIKLDPEVKDEEFLKHKNEMTKFAQERGYINVNFEPYVFERLNEHLAYHSLVWSYKKENIEFLEKSYYVECDHILFIAKATTTLDSKSDQEKFKKIIETSRCER